MCGRKEAAPGFLLLEDGVTTACLPGAWLRREPEHHLVPGAPRSCLQGPQKPAGGSSTSGDAPRDAPGQSPAPRPGRCYPWEFSSPAELTAGIIKRSQYISMRKGGLWFYRPKMPKIVTALRQRAAGWKPRGLEGFVLRCGNSLADKSGTSLPRLP